MLGRKGASVFRDCPEDRMIMAHATSVLPLVLITISIFANDLDLTLLLM